MEKFFKQKQYNHLNGDPMKYIKRYVDEELQDILECMGAVLIGPKWCGKTKKKL